MIRVDIHRPSAIIPADYEYVACEYLKTDGDLGVLMFLQEERRRIREHMASTGGTYSNHEHGGNCHICGAHAIYTILFYHQKSNSYIRTGQDCAQKLEMAGDSEMELFRTRMRDALELQAGKRKAQAVLERDGLAAAWPIYLTPKESDQYAENTIRDIVGKLVQYGNLSDKQANFVRNLLDKVARRPQIEAQRAAEHDAASPLPITEDRIVIRGKVVSVKPPRDFDFGPHILVQHDSGWKVYGSLPSSIRDVSRGDTVEFSAKIKPSDKDSKFGFFSRPTKASIVTKANQE